MGQPSFVNITTKGYNNSKCRPTSRKKNNKEQCYSKYIWKKFPCDVVHIRYPERSGLSSRIDERHNCARTRTHSGRGKSSLFCAWHTGSESEIPSKKQNKTRTTQTKTTRRGCVPLAVRISASNLPHRQAPYLQDSSRGEAFLGRVRVVVQEPKEKISQIVLLLWRSSCT